MAADAPRKRPLRLTKEQPEVHILGEIVGVSGLADGGVSLNFAVEADEQFWELISGSARAQSHVSYAMDDDIAVIAHPIDLHYRCSSMSGWPRFVIQVWQMDSVGRNDLAGYCVGAVPAQPGRSKIDLPLWRPAGTLSEELGAYFVGATPQLISDAVVSREAWEKRLRLETTSRGQVHLDLSVVLRNFAEVYADV